MITISTIQSISDHALELLACTDHLRRHPETKEAFSYSVNISQSLRKLYIASLMQERRLICVAGPQGVGKTTLMKNFYGIDSKYFNATLDRGERLPVLITEDNVQEPLMKRCLIQKDDNGSYLLQNQVVKSAEEFVELTRGESDNVMYLELIVPYRHTNTKSVSFMLLPGFEDSNNYWEELIQFSVNSADAAIYVLMASSSSDNDNYVHMNDVRNNYGKNVVYVISRSDESVNDNEEIKKHCVETLGLIGQEDRIVCAGQYTDQSKNEKWISALKESLNKHVYSTEDFERKRNDEYVLKELNVIKENLYSILDIIKSDDSEVFIGLKNHSSLKHFDRTISKQRNDLSKKIDTQFLHAQEESKKRLLELTKIQGSIWTSIKRSIFGPTIDDQFVKPRKLIEDSLKSADGRWIPELCFVQAIQESIPAITGKKSENSVLRNLIDISDDNQYSLIPDGQHSRDLLCDVKALMQLNPHPSDPVKIKGDDKNIFKALAEVAILYFGAQNCNTLASNRIESQFEPHQMESLDKTIVEGGKSSKKFALGLAGLMGVDLLGDGTINFVTQMAASVSAPLEMAGVLSLAVVALGAGTAILRDAHRVQCNDYRSACLAIDTAYDSYKNQLLGNFDLTMGRIRDIIEDNLSSMTEDRQLFKTEYNAIVEANILLDIIEKQSMESMKSAYGLRGFDKQ